MHLFHFGGFKSLKLSENKVSEVGSLGAELLDTDYASDPPLWVLQICVHIQADPAPPPRSLA